MSTSKTIITQDNKELKILEAQQRVSRHNQIQDPKPCFSAYMDGLVLPQPGERNQMFYALTAEFRRMGYDEGMTYTRMTAYYFKLPDEITSPADHGPFTLKEVETIVRAVFRSTKNKSYGCNHHFWDRVCIGDSCTFKKKLSGKSQSFETGFFYFIRNWLNSDLNGSDIKIYMALMLAEERRGIKPGAMIFVSQRELGELSGVFRTKVSKSLTSLKDHKLIEYKPGKQLGIASEIRRKIPIPKHTPCTQKEHGIDSS